MRLPAKPRGAKASRAQPPDRPNLIRIARESADRRLAEMVVNF